MRNSKVWLVLGATTGLGYAAIKYLASNKQFVIALAGSDFIAAPLIDESSEHLCVIQAGITEVTHIQTALEKLFDLHGPIDFVINNSNYGLFNQSYTKTSTEIKNDVETSVLATIQLITVLLPYLSKSPHASIINIPPQLCLATLPNKNDADKLALGMETFLKTLHEKLKTFGCVLTFLEPGQRFTELPV